MKKIMELCKKFDVTVSVEYIDECEGFVYIATKYNSDRKRSFGMGIRQDDFEQETILNAFIEQFCKRVEEEFSEFPPIVKILERADVVWYDDMLDGSRVVKSKNVDSPLTDEEKEMLKRMWEAQGLKLKVVFG